MDKFVRSIEDSLQVSSDTSSYQGDFDETVNCYKCGKTANLMSIVDDNKGVISMNPPKQYKPSSFAQIRERRAKGIKGDVQNIWPHDSMAMASYLGMYCGEVTTIWNQA